MGEFRYIGVTSLHDPRQCLRGPIGRAAHAAANDPGGSPGKILLNALRHSLDSSHLSPTLVLDGTSPTGTAVNPDNFTWYVAPQQLQKCPIEEIRCQVADLFKCVWDPHKCDYVHDQQLRLHALTDKEILQRKKYLANGTPGERRATALERVDRWLVEARRHGGISHAQMQDLLYRIEIRSNIPQYEFELDLAGLNLVGLPQIPKDVTALNVSDNCLRTVSFPKNLRTLRMSANNLGIKEAFFLLWNLPSSVKRLELNENRIGLMLAIPYQLKHCSLSGNGLMFLPRVPSGLRSLHVDRNELSTLPHLATASNLEVLDLRHNEFQFFPQTLNELRPTCTVDLRGNDVFSVQLPPGSPRITFPSAGDDARELPAASPHSLSAEIRKWIRDADEATLKQWREIAREPNAQAFYKFLQKLRLSDSYKIEGFRATIATWLGELARPDRAELRERSFTVCRKAGDSCGDRAGLRWTELNILQVEDKIRRGEFEGRTRDLLQVARQVYRLKVLSELATRYVLKYAASDPIEVHLGFQVKTREALELSLVLPKMNYGAANYSIYSFEAADAITLVRLREPWEFLDFLCQDYEGWQYELQRNFAEPYEQAQEKRLALFEEQFESMLDQRLRDAGLALDDEDARREAGVAVARELNGRIMKELSLAYLKSLGLADIPL